MNRDGRRRWIMGLGLTASFAVVSCAPAPSPTALEPSSTVTRSPTVACLNRVDQATCDKALPVILQAVETSGWTPTQVWIDGGELSPDIEQLFDRNAMFPPLSEPSGGSHFGTAEVAFAGTDKHAGMNLSWVGSEVVADFIGYAVPGPGWCSGICPGPSATT
jgi:hypothetical protein